MLLNAMHSSCSKVQHSTGITTGFFTIIITIIIKNVFII